MLHGWYGVASKKISQQFLSWTLYESPCNNSDIPKAMDNKSGRCRNTEIQRISFCGMFFSFPISIPVSLPLLQDRLMAQIGWAAFRRCLETLLSSKFSNILTTKLWLAPQNRIHAIGSGDRNSKYFVTQGKSRHDSSYIWCTSDTGSMISKDNIRKENGQLRRCNIPEKM